MHKLPDATAVGSSKKGNAQDGKSATVVADPGKDRLRAEQNVARTQILGTLRTRHESFKHAVIVDFCWYHERVEQAHALAERLTAHYATLASFQTELNTLHSDLCLCIPNSSLPVATATTTATGNDVSSSEREESTLSSLAAQSLLVHAGMQRIGDLLSLYTQKVARDFVDAQSDADRKLTEYNTVRRKAQRYAKRRLTPDVHGAPPASVTQAQQSASNTTKPTKSSWRDWITSETESDSESDSSESERESEKWARFEIALAQRLSTHHDAYQTAESDAFTKREMAAAYRTRSLEDAFLLLARLQFVYYAPIQVENMRRLDSSETLARLRNILRQHMAILPHESDSGEPDRLVVKGEWKSSAASSLVGSVVSRLTAPNVRDSVRSLADAHRRAERQGVDFS